ncbi:MAG: DNA double-strand break repair nuclease NurA [Thermoprotei archaeon]|nr:DNA double-strand break repair nuclease NurA [Thermoprotei archaeon]
MAQHLLVLGIVMEDYDFASLFLSEVEHKKHELLKYFALKDGMYSAIEYLRRKLLRHWISIESDRIRKAQERAKSINVIAVDGSLQGNFYAHGRALYVIRSVAFSTSGSERYLTVEFDASTRSKSVISAMRLLAERCEYEVALKMLSHMSHTTPSAILLDGSLYTRLVHLPAEIAVDRNKTAYIRTMRSFLELYTEASRLGIPILGISKDSLSEHLRLALLREAIVELLTVLAERGVIEPKALKSAMPLRQLLRMCASYVDKHMHNSLESSIIRELLSDLKHRRSDYAFLMTLHLPPGHSSPLLVGCLRRRCVKRFRELEERGILEFVTRRWRSSADERGSSQKFIAEASQVLMRLRRIPALYILYVIAEPGAIPIRVEILPPVEKSPSFFSFENVRFTSIPEDLLERVLDVVLGGYADVTIYNTWLFAAHRLAKISSKEFQAYEAYLRNLGLNLIPRRRIWLG